MRTIISFSIAGLLAAGIYSLSTADAQQPSATKKVADKARTALQKTLVDDTHAHADAPPAPKKAICVLIPSKGSEVRGMLTLVDRGAVVEITGEVTGLTPGKHGFHVHEFGDLSSPDGSAAGSHYDPHGSGKHGGLEGKERHAGDLGNITADASGKAMVNIKAEGLQVHFIVGRSLVVHAKADDLKSQPSGDSGGRVAVGVIGIANEKPAAAPTKGPATKTTTEKKTK